MKGLVKTAGAKPSIVANKAPGPKGFQGGLSGLVEEKPLIPEEKPLVREARETIEAAKKQREEEAVKSREDIDFSKGSVDAGLSKDQKTNKNFGITKGTVKKQIRILEESDKKQDPAVSKDSKHGKLSKAQLTPFHKPASTDSNKGPQAKPTKNISQEIAGLAALVNEGVKGNISQTLPKQAHKPTKLTTNPPVPLAPVQFNAKEQSLFKEFTQQIHDYPTCQNSQNITHKHSKKNADILSKNANFCAKDMEPLKAAVHKECDRAGDDSWRITFDVTLDREAPLFMPRKKRNGSPALDENNKQIYDVIYSAEQGDGSFKIDPARSFIAPDDIPEGTYSSVKKDIRDICQAHHKEQGADKKTDIAEDFSVKYARGVAASIKLPPETFPSKTEEDKGQNANDIAADLNNKNKEYEPIPVKGDGAKAMGRPKGADPNQ